MPHIDRETVLKEVSQFYLNSRDFNGIPAEALANKCSVDWFDLQEILREFIKEDIGSLTE